MQETTKIKVFDVFVPADGEVVSFTSPTGAVEEIVFVLEDMGLQDVPNDLRAEWDRQVVALQTGEKWEHPDGPDFYIACREMTDEEYRTMQEAEQQEHRWLELMDAAGIGYMLHHEGIDFADEEEKRKAFDLARENGLHLIVEDEQSDPDMTMEIADTLCE